MVSVIQQSGEVERPVGLLLAGLVHIWPSPPPNSG